MTIWVQGLGGKIATAVFITFAAVANMFGGTRTITVTPQQSAIVYLAISSSAPKIAGTSSQGAIWIPSLSHIPTSSLAIDVHANATTTQNLLPKVKARPWKTLAQATSTATFTNSTPTIAGTISTPKIIVAAPKPTSTVITNANATKATSIVTTTSTMPQTITAQWLLEQSAFSVKERLDGSYEGAFTASFNGTNIASWNFGDTTVGGIGNVPQFSATYSCDPAPNAPTTASIDQNDTFNVRSTYSCTVSLTPLTGADQRTQSQTFSLNTGPGELLSAAPPSMDTHLTEGINSGGFIFTNDDTEPITITAATFDISYSGLSLIYGPLILRPIDPVTGNGVTDLDMETFPSTSQFAHAAAGVSVPVSLTVPAQGQKLLPLDIVNIHKMSVDGVNPTVTITLRGITTNRTDIKTVLNDPTITWSCEVALTPYDPNATSGAYASGQACTN